MCLVLFLCGQKKMLENVYAVGLTLFNGTVQQIKDGFLANINQNGLDYMELSHSQVLKFIRSKPEFTRYEEDAVTIAFNHYQAAKNHGLFKEEELKARTHAVSGWWQCLRYRALLLGMPETICERGVCCLYCNKTEPMFALFSRCGQCKAAFYCNRTCQKADWYRHKYACSSMNPIPRPTKITELIPLLKAIHVEVKIDISEQLCKAQPHRPLLYVETSDKRGYLIVPSPKWTVTDWNTQVKIGLCDTMQEVVELFSQLQKKQPIVKTTGCLLLGAEMHSQQCKPDCQCLVPVFIEHI
jgi:hypothetical protein